MFYKALSVQLNLYIEELSYLIGKTNSIAEFCETPILSDGFDLNEDEKIKLEKLSNILINISAKLDSIKQDIKSVENVQI